MAVYVAYQAVGAVENKRVASLTLRGSFIGNPKPCYPVKLSRSYSMPTQPTTHQPQSAFTQAQSDCVYFWGPPTPSDLQKYIQKLDEDARRCEAWRQEMIKGTYWMREIVWQLEEANDYQRGHIGNILHDDVVQMKSSASRRL
jgi:hypothetical protein